MVRHFLIVLIWGFTFNACAQGPGRYDTDSLLNLLSHTGKIYQALLNADNIYHLSGIDTANISLKAFRFAYLEKYFIDKRRVHIKHRHRYRNKSIITVVDFSKKGNARRFAVIDLAHQRLLFDTLVSQGSGKGGLKNDKYQVPVLFSNTVNSDLSSLGLMGTRKSRQTENPCHLCKYAAIKKHNDVIVLEGLEKGINNNARERDIVIHTTGSADLSTSENLNINDTNYRVNTSECKCYRTGDEGKVRGIAAYASACGLAGNNGFIGQSNGCLVLPEDDHIEIMETIKRKSLMFIYSDVVNDGYNYFRDSPIVKRLIQYTESHMINLTTY